MTITVFLADDHAVVRDGLQFLLEAQGDMQVVGHAADGHEAVQQVTELCPDVVIMDIGMPELNGIEATRRIRAACPSVQVIILSMHSTTEHISRALQAGARGYVLKEAAGAEVARAVRAVHSGHCYMGQKVQDQLVDNYVHQYGATEVRSPLATLSPRERQVFQFVVEGRSSTDIASALSLSRKTVETYRSRMMRKLGISDMATLVRFAIQNGLMTLE